MGWGAMRWWVWWVEGEGWMESDGRCEIGRDKCDERHWMRRVGRMASEGRR